jgi:hypothetical protein
LEESCFVGLFHKVAQRETTDIFGGNCSNNFEY